MGISSCLPWGFQGSNSGGQVGPQGLLAAEMTHVSYLFHVNLPSHLLTGTEVAQHVGALAALPEFSSQHLHGVSQLSDAAQMHMRTEDSYKLH